MCNYHMLVTSVKRTDSAAAPQRSPVGAIFEHELRNDKLSEKRREPTDQKAMEKLQQQATVDGPRRP